MTTSVHVDFKGQAPGAAPPRVPGQPGLGMQHSAEVELALSQELSGPRAACLGGLTGVVLCWHWAGVGTGRQGEAGGSRTIGSGWPPGWLEGAGAER